MAGGSESLEKPCPYGPRHRHIWQAKHKKQPADSASIAIWFRCCAPVGLASSSCGSVHSNSRPELVLLVCSTRLGILGAETEIDTFAAVLLDQAGLPQEKHT